MLDLDLFLEGKTTLEHAVPALNVVHGNAGSLFMGALKKPMIEAMEPEDA